MRGADISQDALFVTVTVEDFVPADHPLRALRELINEALKDLDGLFGSIYADAGRESIPPERLVRALLLQVLYTIRSERQLMEQVRYNLLYRWFVGLTLDEAKAQLAEVAEQFEDVRPLLEFISVAGRGIVR